MPKEGERLLVILLSKCAFSSCYGLKTEFKGGCFLNSTSCIKYITTKNLLYSTGNSIQCSMVTSVGGKSNTSGTYVYI